MGATTIAVVTADFIHSRRYSAASRKRLGKALQAAFKAAHTTFPKNAVTGLGLRVTAGDEFQFVLQDVAHSLPFVLYMRSVLATQSLKPAARFRAAIGVGEARIAPARGPRASPYEWDGPAFVRAREGIEALAGKRGFIRWTSIRTGEPRLDRSLRVVNGFQDYMQQAWTVAQWEAVRWALRGMTQTAIAKRIKVAHQNVSKRLAAAGWPVFDESLEFVQDSLHLHLQDGATR